jgi:Leucine-rich repeat (LRR) protein
MHLDDDIVHRILLSVEFKERHALAGVSKQFSSILSRRTDTWENDAEFVVKNTDAFELCVRWMRTRWFRSLRICIKYPWQLYDAYKDLEKCNGFFNFLVAFAPRLRRLNVSASYHIHLKYAPFINACNSLKSLKMNAYKIHSDLDLNTFKSLETLSIESLEPIRVVAKDITLRSLTTLKMKSKSVAIDNMTLPNLKKLSLDGAHITNLPSNLGKLTSLSLQRCNMIDLPESLSTLASLKCLRASRNSLTAIENLPPNLAMLDVSHNMCVEFQTIHTRLEILDISCNPCIARLETLTLPNLKSVSCSAIPTQKFFSKSKYLQTIHIHEPCRGYRHAHQATPQIPHGPTTTATRLFIDPEMYDVRGASGELASFLRSNPHVEVLASFN